VKWSFKDTTYNEQQVRVYLTLCVLAKYDYSLDRREHAHCP